MEGLVIEYATNAHLEAVVAIARQDLELLGWVPKGVFTEAIANNHILIAHNNARVFGFVEFGGTTKDKWTIYKIATAKPARNKGIGRALITVLADKAKEKNAGLRLKVTEDNENAIPFYLKNGFQVIEIEQSKQRKVIVMEKAC